MRGLFEDSKPLSFELRDLRSELTEWKTFQVLSFVLRWLHVRKNPELYRLVSQEIVPNDFFIFRPLALKAGK